MTALAQRVVELGDALGAGDLSVVGNGMYFADRELIDEEVTDTGLPAPEWKRTDKGATIGLVWAAPLPWDERSQAEQMRLLTKGANQLVNSFRPRLERTGAEV